MFIKKVTKRNMESGAICLTNNSLCSCRFENKPNMKRLFIWELCPINGEYHKIYSKI